MNVPKAFRPGYEATRPSNPILADRYASHLTIGDPDADAVMEELSGLRPSRIDESVRALLAGEGNVHSAPGVLRDFINKSVDELPEWYRSVDLMPSTKTFFRQQLPFLIAFATSTIVRGFSTTISLSFAMSGKVLVSARARLRHNIRHLLEILMPEGLEPYGDGWKLAIRTRLIHARARKLIAASPHWDHEMYGLPVSASHGALASAGFSAMLLEDAARLGARATKEERRSFMHMWRCSAWLMGVPDELTCRTEEEGHELLRIGFGCEPPATKECKLMANALISSVPNIIGVDDKALQKKQVDLFFRLARRMIGGRVADDLGLPRKWSLGMITFVKMQIFFKKLRGWLPIFRDEDYGVAQMKDLLDMSRLVDEGAEYGFSYRLPTQLYRNDNAARTPEEPPNRA